MEYKNFNFHGISLTYKSLLEMLENNTFSLIHTFFIYQQNLFFYKIFRIGYAEDPAFIFKDPIKIKIISSDKKQELIILAHSNLDIKKFCEEKSINIDELTFTDKHKYENNNFQNCYEYIENNELRLSFPDLRKLKKISQKSVMNIKNKYKVEEYSAYFKDYFDDVNLSPDFEFEFDNNEFRKQIFGNLAILHFHSLDCFKFTGPFNIGKSVTLLEYCRTSDSAFYINLKILTNKPIYDCYSILQEEFSRISLNLFEQIQGIIISNYSLLTLPLNLVVIIMDTLENNNGNYLFALDQFKEELFSTDLLTKLRKKRNKVKIVYCSSINDNKIRLECLKTWKKYNNSNPKKLDVESQNYYFYYIDIYSQSILKANSPIEDVINIKRFKKYYDTNSTNEEKITKIKEHINNKMEKFSEQVNMSFDHMIIYIKNIINKSYDNDKLDTIMEYCPLKYFLIRFGESKFKIEIQFSLMNQILNRELYEKEIYNYFKNKKYLKNLIGNKNIKGDYFEEAAKNGLRKEKFLPSKFDITLELKEIISMDKIEGNSLDIEYLEDKLDEEEEEEDNDFEEKNMIIENPENFNNNDDESNYMDIENNNSDEYIRLDLNELLSNFSIDENEDDGETTIIFENLESYRKGEIRKLREDDDKKYVVTDKYTGDETFFLSQKSKSGRTLDCGYLYGERKDKKFIGFQIKCLFEKTTTIKKNAFKKDIIKRNLQKILINSLYLLNCRINEWYYYLIIYKNPIISKCNMNKQLFNKVQNFIEVILYDPLEKKFYDSKNREIKTLPITEKANLDCVYDILDSYNLKQKHAIQKRDYKKLEKSFNKSFKFMEKENVTEIIKKISEIMDIKKTKIVELLCKCKINKFEYPNYDCIYLYPTSDKKIFYGMKTIKNKENKPEEIYYDLDREIKISSQLFYKDVNPSNSYVYILGIRNKVYNDLSVSSNYNSKGEKRFKSES